MKKLDLQIQCGSYVTESKMSKSAKLQLLNFIQKEATEEQLMSLYLDGKIVKLDEQAKEVVRDRFEALNEVSVLLPAVLIYGAVKVAAKTLKLTINSLGCRQKRGAEFVLCVKTARAKSLEAKASALKASLPRCKDTSKPDKCEKRIKKEIWKVQKDIIKVKSKARA